ncbi:MAG: MBL fold metallo-hydrolase [Victivallales bacterium]|nr:MBL fold metallo-hydrolase [Victivallales bacterium]
MNIKTLSVGLLGTNCYVIDNDNSCYIIDPGGDAGHIVSAAKKTKKNVKAVLLTHPHIDHIAGINEVCKELDVTTVYLHEKDTLLYKSPDNSMLPFMPPLKNPPATVNKIADPNFEIIHTPGHTKGSVSFYFTNDGILFSGDTLFQGGVGRTDFPGGSYSEIMSSIKDKLLKLPDNTIVYPGHGPKTTIKKEKDSNPFF